MQQHSLLQTKLYIPPIRRELVSRPRLLDWLNAGLHRNLMLVSAPAGFGKTTLVAEWLAVCERLEPKVRAAWLSLDEGDNDTARFLAYLIAALRTIEANIGKGALSALQSPQPPLAEVVLTQLINEITAIPRSMILVLDDYHLLEAQAIHDALTFLLEHLPSQMHVVIASREDPPLPLARLRARDQLIELRATDLRFTSSEAADFLNRVMGLGLSAEDVAALEARTEGWIAGLQLAALALQGPISMQGRKDPATLIESFTGSHRFVLDYLVEEVLEQQSKSIQTFLLQTTVLKRLTGSLCDAILSRGAEEQRSEWDPDTSAPHLPSSSASGQEILEHLERSNLFVIPLDEERRWYRYHHLFADLLWQRLHRTQPEQIPGLHGRASLWYEQNGFVDEAIEHALRAEDFGRAADLVEGRAETLWGSGEQIRLQGWLEALPAEQVCSRPQLCIFHAWGLFASGQQSAAKQSLQAAERALDRTAGRETDAAPAKRVHMPVSDMTKIQGRAAAVRAFMASFRGDVSDIIQYSRQALERLPEQDLVWRSSATIALGDAYSFNGELVAACRARLEALEASKATGNWYMILIASMKLAVTLRQQGQLQRVIETCQQQWQLAKESGLSQTAVVGWLLAVWGEVLAELNDLERAIDRAERGTELTERSGDVAMIGWSYVCLVRALFSRGDMAGAEEIIQRMENIARETHVPPWITSLMAAWQARIWLAQDKLDAASQWAQERGLDADRDPALVHEMEYIALARLLIAQGRQDEASKLLRRLLDATEAGGRISRAIEILNLQALSAQAGDDTAKTMTSLERALSLAEPGGFVGIFVDEGPPMACLLYQALDRGIAPDYTRRLLAAFPVVEPEKTAPSSTKVPKSELIEPLSEREIEVLQLIAEGLTNREIATRLSLSVNTVKVHSRNIYGKLGAHNRTEAAARAQALGILPST
jgi:LuxR family maltose regulon positive regulatory protein